MMSGKAHDFSRGMKAKQQQVVIPTPFSLVLIAGDSSVDERTKASSEAWYFSARRSHDDERESESET